MTDFLKMDVFFVVATLSVVILTVLIAFVIVRVLSILRKLDDIAELARAGSKEIHEDLEAVRAKVKEGGIRIGHIFGLFAGTRKKKPGRRITRRS